MEEMLPGLRKYPHIFSPIMIGKLKVKNRVKYASTETNFNYRDGYVSDKEVGYMEAQARGGAGIVTTQGAYTDPRGEGRGYVGMMAIWDDKFIPGLKRLADVIHKHGSASCLQLMHCGRVGSKLNLPAGAELVAPSAIAMTGRIWTDSQGEQPYDQPREMTQKHVEQAIAEYALAAKNAVAAGLDGVEVHGANGYLINQFLDPGSNQRSDAYGGDAARRNRFALDVAAAVIAKIGADRVGIRLSPYGVFNDMSGNYDGIVDQYVALAAAAGGLGLAYLHLVDHSAMGAPKPEPTTVQAICQAFRAAGGGTVILSGGYDAERAEADLQSGAADLIAFGRPFIANPDLVARLQSGKELAVPDQTTFYSPGEAGYTDYPAL